MTVEEAIVERLGATSAVTALVSTRIYQLKLPQQPTYPAIRVQLVVERTGHHLRGRDGLAPVRVMVDMFAMEVSGSDPYASATTVGATVFDALDGKRFLAGSPPALNIRGVLRVDRRVGYEADELRLVRESQDYMVWGKAVS